MDAAKHQRRISYEAVGEKLLILTCLRSLAGKYEDEIKNNSFLDWLDEDPVATGKAYKMVYNMEIRAHVVAMKSGDDCR